MILERKLPVCLLDFVDTGVTVDSEYAVVIFGHGCVLLNSIAEIHDF